MRSAFVSFRIETQQILRAEEIWLKVDKTCKDHSKSMPQNDETVHQIGSEPPSTTKPLRPTTLKGVTSRVTGLPSQSETIVKGPYNACHVEKTETGAKQYSRTKKS